jgi:hypothetical protein
MKTNLPGTLTKVLRQRRASQEKFRGLQPGNGKSEVLVDMQNNRKQTVL